jgi:hypothetical protein
MIRQKLLYAFIFVIGTMIGHYLCLAYLKLIGG